MINWYDIKRRTETKDADGIPVITWTYQGTRNMDIQAVQWSSRESANRVAISLGGIEYVPTMYGFTSNETLMTAGDVITKDSGTSEWLCLRTYVHEEHIEFDLVTVVTS